jgi:8-oxo-dGTP diphosphatase
MPLPDRSAVLVIRDQSVLLIERIKAGRPPYYVLPGGGIETGETPEEAAKREMKEELGVEVSVSARELDVQQKDRKTWILRAILRSKNEPAWQEDQLQTSDNCYRAVWLPISHLNSSEVYPASAAEVARKFSDN